MKSGTILGNPKIENMYSVREYEEGDVVSLDSTGDRMTVTAINEHGHNCTSVDLLDLIAWLRQVHPEILVDPSSSEG
jgi:hypothetical protein